MIPSWSRQTSRKPVTSQKPPTNFDPRCNNGPGVHTVHSKWSSLVWSLESEDGGHLEVTRDPYPPYLADST
jgi:hypothetical protein